MENRFIKTIKQIWKDDLWVVLLDIVAVNLAYLIALVLRGALDDFAYQGASNIARFFSFHFRLVFVFLLAIDFSLLSS